MKPIAMIYDGVMAAMSAAVGFFVGLALLLMAQLVVTGAWAMVIILTVYCIVMYLIVVATGWALNFGVKAPTGAQGVFEQRRKRNSRIGFLVGAAAAFLASMFIPPEQIVGYF